MSRQLKPIVTDLHKIIIASLDNLNGEIFKQNAEKGHV